MESSDRDDGIKSTIDAVKEFCNELINVIKEDY